MTSDERWQRLYSPMPKRQQASAGLDSEIRIHRVIAEESLRDAQKAIEEIRAARDAARKAAAK